jgi:hypothetical protein
MGHIPVTSSYSRRCGISHHVDRARGGGCGVFSSDGGVPTYTNSMQARLKIVAPERGVAGGDMAEV